MRYLKIHCGNGYCGCDEDWLAECEEDEEITCYDVKEMYTYESGAGGVTPKDEEEEDYDPEYDITWEEYDQEIFDNIIIEEITKEEFEKIRDEEGWEIR